MIKQYINIKIIHFHFNLTSLIFYNLFIFSHVAIISIMCSLSPYLTIQGQSSAKVVTISLDKTDYKYHLHGELLAVSNSQGKITIFQRKDNKFKKINQFVGDQGSIWSIAWADPKYGRVIGIGTFKKKVAIFQQQNSNWKEIACHQLHQASVNCVEWAPAGLKLYTGGSDGKISILQLVGKTWKTSIFSTNQSAITTLTLQPIPLSDSIPQEDNFYSRITTVSKDQKLRIWSHPNQVKHNQNSELKNKKDGYVVVKEHQLQKQTVRNILWKPIWGTIKDALNLIKLLYCTEEGSVKLIEFQLEGDEYLCQNEYSILEIQSPIVRIAQSLTGNMISASIAQKQGERTLIYSEIDQNEWQYCEQGQ